MNWNIDVIFFPLKTSMLSTDANEVETNEEARETDSRHQAEDSSGSLLFARVPGWTMWREGMNGRNRKLEPLLG